MRRSIAAGLTAALCACTPRGAASETAVVEPTPAAVVPFDQPGHYASWISDTHQSSCSQSWAMFTSVASLVLDLDQGGHARACRGREFRDTGGGWDEVPTERHVREQQGFVGTWRRDGRWLDVTLALADTASCPTIRGYTNLDPMPWHLRCVQRDGPIAPMVPGPILACRFAERTYTEELGYTVHGVLDEAAIVLGPGAGVEVRVSEGERSSSAEVVFATAPIGPDAWTTRPRAPAVPEAVRLPQGM